MNNSTLKEIMNFVCEWCISSGNCRFQNENFRLQCAKIRQEIKERTQWKLERRKIDRKKGRKKDDIEIV